MRLRTAVGCALAALALACGPASRGAPGPAVVRVQDDLGNTFDLQSDRRATAYNLDVAADAAWAALPDAFLALDIPGAVLDHGERLYGVRGWAPPRRIAGEPIARIVDCGSGIGGPNAASYAVRIDVFSRLHAVPGGVVLESWVDAQARPMDVAGATLRCTSLGRLESLIAEQLELRAGR